MNPRVSVVIPTLDRPVLLAEAIASVRAQSFRDFEVVVADCGTGARSVVEEVAAEDPRVRYEPHDGLRSAGAARNRGVRAARAPLIAFLDDDDLWLPDKLARQVDILDAEPDVLLVFSHMERFGARSGVWPDVEVPERPTVKRLLRGNLVPTSAVMVRAEALAAVGGFDETLRFGEDYELWLRLARHGPLRSLPDVHVRYREHSGSISRDVDVELESLAIIYERAEREWKIPRAWLRPALRSLHRRHAARGRGVQALKHRAKAWLV